MTKIFSNVHKTMFKTLSGILSLVLITTVSLPVSSTDVDGGQQATTPSTTKNASTGSIYTRNAVGPDNRYLYPGRDGRGMGSGYPGYRGQGGSGYPQHRQYGNPPRYPATTTPASPAQQSAPATAADGQKLEATQDCQHRTVEKCPEKPKNPPKSLRQDTRNSAS